jgi:plastocyanin
MTKEAALRRAVSVGVVAGLGLLAALLAAGCGGQSSSGTEPTNSQPEQVVTIRVLAGDAGKLGPDSKHHDTFDPADFSVKLGSPVKLVFLSEDPGTHSFTAGELGINVIVNGGKPGQPTTTTYTFTPKKAGQFRWFCVIPCDDDAHGWAMTADTKGAGKDGFMAGYVTVT